MKPPKLAPAVVAAKQAMEAKNKELAEAREAVKRLEAEYAEAAVAARQAQEDADAALPQCRLVRIRWSSSKEEGDARVVILRRTPGGMLVVRHVGAIAGHEYKFKWAEHYRSFVGAERRASFVSDRTELRDVPQAFQPAPSKETA